MGTLSFTSFAFTTASVNLDTINGGAAPDDWAEYQTTLTPTNRRSGGGSTLTCALFGGGSTSSNTADARTISWTNGTPNASGSNKDCVFNSSFTTGLGVTFTLPADTNVRTAWFLIGAFNTSVYTSDASLSDSSATALHDTTSLTGVGHSASFNPYLVKVSYSANAPSQTLTVSFYNQATAPQTVTVQAVAVAQQSGASAQGSESARPYSLGRLGLGQVFKRLRSTYNDTVATNVTVSITGITSTFSAGTLSPSSAVSISGQSSTFTAGTLAPAFSVALTGQSASFTAGSMVISSALAISGLTVSFSAGTFAPQISVSLTGQTATFTAGTVTVGSNVNVSITGQSASFSAGSVSPAIDITASGSSITSVQGSLTPASQVAISAQSATFSSGALSPSLDISLTGQSATFTPGQMLIPGDVTVSITGLTATFTQGTVTASQDFPPGDTHDGGTQVVRESHYRKILRLKKKGPLQRQDLIDEEIARLIADRQIVLNKVTDDDDVITAYLTVESDELDQLTEIAGHLAAHLTRKH